MSKPQDQLPPWWKAPGKGPLPPVATAPQPMDLDSAEASLSDRLHRGGKLPVGEPYSIPTDSGFARGGEFSDEDGAAFAAAFDKLRAAKSRAEIQAIAANIHAMAATKPDALAVVPKK